MWNHLTFHHKDVIIIYYVLYIVLILFHVIMYQRPVVEAEISRLKSMVI